MRLEEESRRSRNIRESDLLHNNNNNKILDHVASFRITLEIEKDEWKPFRNALDKSDRKKFLMKCGEFKKIELPGCKIKEHKNECTP